MVRKNILSLVKMYSLFKEVKSFCFDIKKKESNILFMDEDMDIILDCVNGALAKWLMIIGIINLF